MKRIVFWISILISLALLVVAFQRLHIDQFWAELRNANLWWLAPGIAFYFAAVWFRAWRWGFMLRSIKKVSASALYPIVVIGYMGNNIYPARIGEVLRAYVLKREEGVPMSSSLATVLLERIIDGIIMLAFVLIGLPSVPSLSETATRLLTFAGAAFAIAIAVFFWLALAPKRVEYLAQYVIQRIAPNRLHAPLMGFVTKFVDGAQSLRSPTDLVLIVISTIVTWLLETGKYWCVANAFGINLPFAGLMLVNGVSNLFTIIPAGPGAVGTFDAGGVLATTALGVSQSLAQAYVLVLHVVLWLPVTLLGIYFMLRRGLKWSDLRQAETVKAG
jgi:uncharacterized protein (TIRG00374 family)